MYTPIWASCHHQIEEFPGRDHRINVVCRCIISVWNLLKFISSVPSKSGCGYIEFNSMLIGVAGASWRATLVRRSVVYTGEE